jgi:hypothetical protein
MRTLCTLLCAFVLWSIGNDARYRPISVQPTFEACHRIYVSFRERGEGAQVLCLPGTINPNH